MTDVDTNLPTREDAIMLRCDPDPTSPGDVWVTACQDSTGYACSKRLTITDENTDQLSLRILDASNEMQSALEKQLREHPPIRIRGNTFNPPVEPIATEPQT